MIEHTIRFVKPTRLRIGAYRVIFKKDEARLIILVVRVGHRREVYY